MCSARQVLKVDVILGILLSLRRWGLLSRYDASCDAVNRVKENRFEPSRQLIDRDLVKDGLCATTKKVLLRSDGSEP